MIGADVSKLDGYGFNLDGYQLKSKECQDELLEITREEVAAHNKRFSKKEEEEEEKRYITYRNAQDWQLNKTKQSESQSWLYVIAMIPLILVVIFILSS